MSREILVAKEAGFCRGVRRAVNLAKEKLQKDSAPLCSLGPLIHNPSVIKSLEEKGMQSLESAPSKEKLAALPKDATLLIRAHGVTTDLRRLLESSGQPILDATCPHVIYIQRLVAKADAEGHAVAILGDKGHAEVLGLLSYARKGFVISAPKEVAPLNLENDSSLTVVCQSTLDQEAFNKISQAILQKFPRAKIHNTRCDATEKRQDEARALCARCEAMVVIGGLTSANSNRLAQICQELRPTFFVADPASWNAAELSQYSAIGVTAGASTPEEDIALVIAKLRSLEG